MECDSGPGGGSSHRPVDSSEDESWNCRISSGEKRESAYLMTGVEGSLCLFFFLKLSLVRTFLQNEPQ